MESEANIKNKISTCLVDLTFVLEKYIKVMDGYDKDILPDTVKINFYSSAQDVLRALDKLDEIMAEISELIAIADSENDLNTRAELKKILDVCVSARSITENYFNESENAIAYQPELFLAIHRIRESTEYALRSIKILIPTQI